MVFRLLVSVALLTGLLFGEGLEGLVLCGYQGWFRGGGESVVHPWHHYAVNGKFEPGHSHIEMWPDVSELGAEERIPTLFRHADGRVAEVFSSLNGATVRRHFRWMREYGIDGVFLQRFATTTRDPKARGEMDEVLRHCRSAAKEESRKWALMYDLIRLADIVSPWAVGRFRTPENAAARVESLLKPDMAWCWDRKIHYLPVAFPGFSWHNLQKSRDREETLDAIPRLGGRFLWSQALAVKRAGANSLYIAMFDEMDEATAIFKTSQDPPIGASPFLREPGLKSDHYLWLSGEIGKFLRSEKEMGETALPMPAR